MNRPVPQVEYSDYTDRQLVTVPLALLAVSLVILAAATAMAGSPVPLGIEFTGGTEMRVVAADSPAEIETA